MVAGKHGNEGNPKVMTDMVEDDLKQFKLRDLDEVSSISPLPKPRLCLCVNRMGVIQKKNANNISF